MLFGDRNRFGIEVELDDNPCGVWMNGKACYRISGQQVGGPEIDDSLRDVLFLWERIACDTDRRNDELFALPLRQLLRTLQCGLYSLDCADQDEIDARAIEGQWARHDIGPTSVAFTSWCIFLVESDSCARCVWAVLDREEETAQERALHLGEFNAILEEAIAYLSGQLAQFEAESQGDGSPGSGNVILP